MGEPTQLSDIIKDNKLPLSVDVVQKRTQFKFFIQADQDYQMEFETLRLVETYDERYLLAHTVMTGTVLVFIFRILYVDSMLHKLAVGF